MSEAPFDPEFLAAIRDTVGDVWADVQAAGLMVGAERLVKLATANRTGASAARGKPGTAAPTYKVLSPRPLLDLRTQYRHRDGAAVKVGDAMMTVAHAACTRAELEAADWIDVDGERWSLAEGAIKDLVATREVIIRKAQA